MAENNSNTHQNYSSYVDPAPDQNYSGKWKGDAANFRFPDEQQTLVENGSGARQNFGSHLHTAKDQGFSGEEWKGEADHPVAGFQFADERRPRVENDCNAQQNPESYRHSAPDQQRCQRWKMDAPFSVAGFQFPDEQQPLQTHADLCTMVANNMNAHQSFEPYSHTAPGQKWSGEWSGNADDRYDNGNNYSCCTTLRIHLVFENPVTTPETRRGARNVFSKMISNTYLLLLHENPVH